MCENRRAHLFMLFMTFFWYNETSIKGGVIVE